MKLKALSTSGCAFQAWRCGVAKVVGTDEIGTDEILKGIEIIDLRFSQLWLCHIAFITLRPSCTGRTVTIEPFLSSQKRQELMPNP